MKTGKIASVEEENDSFTYYFQTKNGGNGKGVTGVKDGYLYWNGKRLEADDDYRIYRVEGEYYVVNNKGKVQKSESKKYDVENYGEDKTFSFDGSKIDEPSQAMKDAASTPKIELIDSVITVDANDVVVINAAN